jgi:hypothetical protein
VKLEHEWRKSHRLSVAEFVDLMLEAVDGYGPLDPAKTKIEIYVGAEGGKGVRTIRFKDGRYLISGSAAPQSGVDRRHWVDIVLTEKSESSRD